MNPDPTPSSAVRRGALAGTRYSVYSPGSGDARATVVLIHGVGMNQTVWAPQIASLTAANYAVLVYDMLGHGASALPPADATLDDYAGQLERLIDGLGIGRAHLVGHSMGALVALEFALTRASRTLSVAALNAVYDRSPAQREAVMARAAALSEGAADGTGNATETIPSIDTTIARWFGDPVPAALRDAAESVRALLLSADPIGYARTYRLFACSDAVHVGRLTQLDVPALFVTGDGDANSSPAMSHAMAQAAPNGRADVIAHARHMVTVSHPNEVNTRVVAFLDDATPRARGNPTTADRRDHHA